MRKLAFLLPTLLLFSGSSHPVSAAQVLRFDSPELGIAFEYPANWRISFATPRGVLPNEVYSIRVDGDATTGFAISLYNLSTPVTHDNLDAVLHDIEDPARAWIAGQPGGHLVDFSDISIDDADGQEYSYEFTQGGKLMFSDMIIVPYGGRAYEISQWALDDQYDDKLEVFDEIFSSLKLPWSHPEPAP
jgi:hypothetical protein